MRVNYPASSIASHRATISASRSGTVSLSPTISQYFMESLPFSSPDEFPTPLNLRRAPSFRMFGRRIADIIKRFARQRDDMRPKEFTACLIFASNGNSCVVQSTRYDVKARHSTDRGPLSEVSLA